MQSATDTVDSLPPALRSLVGACLPARPPTRVGSRTTSARIYGKELREKELRALMLKRHRQLPTTS